MNKIKSTVIKISLLLCLNSVVHQHSMAQNYLVPQEIQKDTLLQKNEGNQFTMIWWVPTQFWRASFQQSGKMSEQGINEFLKYFKGYTMVAIVNAELSMMATGKFTDEKTIRENLRIKDNQGQILKPLGEEAITAELNQFSQFLKPILSNMMGSMGKSFHFFIFETTDKNGKDTVDAAQKGQLTVTLFNKDYVYRLPLGSVVPPKFDGKTGEKFPGNFSFNPYTGDELILK